MVEADDSRLSPKHDELNELQEVPADLVIAAYRVLLGREPENDKVVREKTQHYMSAEHLLRAFLDSPEFRKKHRDYASEVDAVYRSATAHVDVDVTPAVLSRLLERIKGQWTSLGESEPFWSVVSHNRFRMANIHRTAQEFYGGGAGAAKLVDVFSQRNGVARASGTCLELGCGVGRVTSSLAKSFDRVVAVDISQGNLNLARTHLQNSGIDNVDLLLLSDLIQLQDITDFDYFYCIIVLQHNPPPIIAEMLRTILKNLKRGGSFLFQVPTHRPGYQFNAQAYLESHDPVGVGFEMHLLPMHVVLGIIEHTGGRVKEVLADNWTGVSGSHTFFGVKD